MIRVTHGSVSKEFPVMSNYSHDLSRFTMASNIADGLNQAFNKWPAMFNSMYYGMSDSDRWTALLATQTAALLLIEQGELLNYTVASDMLDHFLDESGTDYIIDFTAMLNNDEHIL